MRKIVIGGAALALGVSTAVATGAFAGGQPQQTVNGGGQVLASSDATGAGDTIAFTAQGLSTSDDSARGQFQYVPHASATPDNPKFHGTVTCLQVDPATSDSPATARIGGVDRDTTPFRLVVTDAGTGVQGADTILLQHPATEPGMGSLCDPQNGDDSGSLTLARGNVTIHKAKN